MTMASMKNSPFQLTRFASIYCLIILLCLPILSQAQLLVGGANPYDQYITNLIGGGITISNPVINCDTVVPQMGGFNTGVNPTNIGLNEGTLLTSGWIAYAPGPNNLAGIGLLLQNPGDPDLDNLPGVFGTNDACAMEFDFVPLCDSIGIRYVFASEEYPEFVGSFNDPFAFFLSGPGVGTNVNIATVPGQPGVPVTINNISPITNSQYYLDNTGGQAIQYDGFTVVLLATSQVMPCSTYHVKLVIADDVDDQYDSAVFLEKGGISCLTPIPPSVSTASAGAFGKATQEDCQNGAFTVKFNGDTTVANTVNYSVAGTATAGLDYVPLSGTVVIPAMQSTAIIPVTVLSDNLVEGTESIIIEVVDTAVCNNLSFSRDTVFIFDKLLTDAGPDQVLCAGDSVGIGSAPAAQTTYSWTPVAGLTNPLIANPMFSTTLAGPFTQQYILTATDSLGCQATDTMEISILPNPLANFMVTDSICVNTPLTVSYTGGAATATFSWDFDGGNAIPGTGAGPHTVSWSTPGTKDVTLIVVENGCASSLFTQQVIVLPTPAVVLTGPIDICLEEEAQISYTGNAGASANLSWDFGGGIISSGSGTGPYQVYWTSSGTKKICLEVEEYGCKSGLECINVEVKPKPATGILPVSDQCFQDNRYGFLSTVTTANAYHWNFGANAVPASSTLQNPTAIIYGAPGPKTVSHTIEVDGCLSDTVTTNFEVIPMPETDFTVSATELCEGECITFSYSGSPAYTGQTYSWTFEGGAPDTSNLANPGCIFFEEPGPKEIDIIVNYRGCVTDSSMEVEVIERPIVKLSGESLICRGDSSLLTATGGETWLWSTGQTSQSIWVSPSTASTYTVTGFNSGCAGNTDSITVFQYVDPIASFFAEPDSGFAPLSVNFINTSQNATDYLWDFGRGVSGPDITTANPSHIFPYAGTYTVTLYAYNQGGCVDSFSQSIFADSSHLYVPNAFSPNGDDINDQWYVGHVGMEQFELQIYSRWGQLVFETQSIDFRWDGTHNGVPLPEGVYVYVLKAVGLNKRKTERKGSIILLR